jgi:hypothetical protein
MVDLNSSFMVRLSRNSNVSESSYVKSSNQTGSTIIICGIFGVVLIVIILLTYRVFHEFCRSKKQKNKRQSIYSRRVSSLYPTRSNTISESRGVSAIYIVPVRRNTIIDIIEESPPLYHSFTELESDPTTRL